jgi:gamma-glutamyltranspeptidase/glutathione hydrolase
LLGKAYNDERRRLVGAEASRELRPGEVPGHGGPVDWRIAADGDGDPHHFVNAGAGEPTVAASGEMRGDTCHLDVIDRHGNMVSATPSGGWLHGSPVIPDLGFCLTTRAQMFWLDEGRPASLAPGKRPRTTLTPSMALRDGKPYMAFGTPGGDQQDQWSLVFFLRHIHHGLNLQEAIDAPMFHSEHFPSSFYPRESHPGQIIVEGRFAPSTIAELRRRGHEVKVDEDWSLGRLSAAARDGDCLKTGANPRTMQGYAVGR